MARWSFTEHPTSVGESYLEHMAMAGSFGWALLKGAGACFVHALLPFLFTRTGSGIIASLHERMVSQRHRNPILTAKRTDKPKADCRRA